jgi:hypothetical protein
MLSILLTSITSKQKVVQSEWDAIMERIHMAGVPGAPFHLKIKAYFVDLARNETEHPRLKLEILDPHRCGRYTAL